VLGISVPPVRSIACRRASARALKADSTLSGKSLENAEGNSAGNVLVVIVFSSKDIDVHSNACVHSEGVQDVGEHFRG